MLGFKFLVNPPISSMSRPISLLSCANFHSPFFPFKTQIRNPKSQSRFLLFARNDSGNEQKQQIGSNNNDSDSDYLREDKYPIFNVKLGDLLLNPDPDNLLAVGLTGLLAWASAQVLWQLFIVSLAILIAALKYSFIAALLIFILITLL